MNNSNGYSLIETIAGIPTVNFEGVGLFSPGHITADARQKTGISTEPRPGVSVLTGQMMSENKSKIDGIIHSIGGIKKKIKVPGTNKSHILAVVIKPRFPSIQGG